MKCSIIILAYNQYHFTKSALTDLRKLPADYEIIVVDNGSSDETKMLAHDDRIVYIRNDTNLGFSKGANIGFEKTNGENVIFLNNDIKIKSNFTIWPETLIKSCEDGSLCGPTFGILDKNLNFIKETNKPVYDDNVYRYLSGWCLAGKKDTFINVLINDREVFSEEFFCFWEDVDLSWRAIEKGINIKLVEMPDLVHFCHQTAKKIGINLYYEKSRKIFLEKW